jgi:hypothetical protein
VVGIPGAETPGAGILLRVWPNPARAGSHIGFDLTRPGPVRAEVFDLSGRLVRTLLDQRLDPGQHEILWDGRDRQGTTAGAGVYFLRVVSSEGEQHSRLLRLR